jgi:hypothetical protein
MLAQKTVFPDAKIPSDAAVLRMQPAIKYLASWHRWNSGDVHRKVDGPNDPSLLLTGRNIIIETMSFNLIH